MVNVFHNSLDIHPFFLVNKLLKVNLKNKSVRVHLKSTQDRLALREKAGIAIAYLAYFVANSSQTVSQ